MLDVIEKSILQMLINAGIMRDEDLLVQLELLKKSLSTSSASSNNKTLTEVFKNINANLRHLSLEIRSVIIVPTANTSSRRSSSSSSSSSSEISIREVYHGLVNSEEDFVAKDYGSEFDPIELKYFSEMIYKIMAAHYLSSTDILGFKPAKYNECQATTFLHRLESLGWLQRNDSNYLVLGSRSYLELHTFLSNVITNSEDLDGLAEDAKEARRNELRQQVLKLPQLLNY
jgi:hypothetical protein